MQLLASLIVKMLIALPLRSARFRNNEWEQALVSLRGPTTGYVTHSIEIRRKISLFCWRTTGIPSLTRRYMVDQLSAFCRYTVWSLCEGLRARNAQSKVYGPAFPQFGSRSACVGASKVGIVYRIGTTKASGMVCWNCLPGMTSKCGICGIISWYKCVGCALRSHLC